MIPGKLFRRRKAQARLPNLLCIGVEKCGTTFLNAAFANCPDVLTPRKKELFFFNDFYEEGSDWYQSWFDFDSKPGARWVADITPSYFRARRSLQRIKDTLPDTRIIVVLRHPVYRAFSHYVHRIRHVAPKLEAYGYSFDDILARKDVYALLCPKYGHHLAWLPEYFARDDILLLSYEEDILNPFNAQAKLASFLDLPQLDFSHMLGRRINEGAMPRFYWGGDQGLELDLEGRRWRLPAGQLLLAHAKGSQLWRDLPGELAAANVAAAANWSHSLSGDDVVRIYEQHFAADLKRAQRDFGLDTDQWRALRDPVHYPPAVPDTQYLEALD